MQPCIRSFVVFSLSTSLAVAGLSSTLGGCGSDAEPPAAQTTSSAGGGVGGSGGGTGGGNGGGNGGGGGGGGVGGGVGGGAPIEPCLDSGKYEDAFELTEPGLCVVARYEAPFIVGFDENYVELAPTWGRHGGPLTLKQTGTAFTLARWKLPPGAEGNLALDGTPAPIESAISPMNAPASLFLNASATDLPFGDWTLVGWSEFGTPKGEALLVGPKGIEQRLSTAGLYAVAGLHTQGRARILSASLSGLGQPGSTVGLYASDFCPAGPTFGACGANSGSVKNGLVTKAGDASGPVTVDHAGHAFAVFPSLASDEQTIMGYAAETIAPGAATPVATVLATLAGSGTSLAALAPSANEAGFAFFQPAQTFVPGNVLIQRYEVVQKGKALAPKGAPSNAIVPKAPGSDVRLMVDDKGRLWASLRVDPKQSKSSFFVIDRRSLH